MNNIGGFISCEYVLLKDIDTFVIHNRTRADVNLILGAQWKTLPLSLAHSNFSANSKETASGMIFEHQATISIPLALASDFVRRKCTKMARLGCIIRYKDGNGVVHILGTQEHPLVGIVGEHSGNRASAYSELRVSLHSKNSTAALLE